mgnify:CR=1 FL=1
MLLEVGDLVRVRGKDWLGKPLGVITEIRDLIHDPSGVEYTAVTVIVGAQYYTFSNEDFELISKAERKQNEKN